MEEYMKAIGRLALAGIPARAQEKSSPGKVEIVRLSDMMGKEILAKDRKTELGTVKDVVIDVQRGRAVFAAVARKEDPSRIIAVPSSKLRGVWDDDGKSIKALTIDDDRFLAEAPGVTKEEWDQQENQALLGRLASKEGGASLARASQTKKATVVDVADERIGEIDGIMVNLENSRLLALVGVGGVLGVGERRYV